MNPKIGFSHCLAVLDIRVGPIVICRFPVLTKRRQPDARRFELNHHFAVRPQNVFLLKLESATLYGVRNNY